MKAIRPLSFLMGLTLIGAGGKLIARSLSAKNGKAGEHNADASVSYGHGTRIEKAFTIDRPASELYTFWRDFSNLPLVMSHLKDVEVLDERRSRWHAHGPANLPATWEAEIVDDTPGRRIAWRSTDGNVPNAGSVLFQELPGGRRTELRVEIEWAPPGGALGTSLAHLIGDDPGMMVETDLRRFKSTMEAGSVALDGTDETGEGARGVHQEDRRL